MRRSYGFLFLPGGKNITSPYIAEFIRQVASHTGVETAVVHGDTWDGVTNILPENLPKLLKSSCFDHVISCNDSAIFANDIDSNCNSVWLTDPSGASSFEFECESHAVDSFLCSSRLEADRLQAKLRLPLSRFGVVQTIFGPSEEAPRLMSEFTISLVCLSEKDKRILKRTDIIKSQFKATTGKEPEIRCLDESMSLPDLNGSFVAIIPGLDESLSYRWILDYCSSQGIPVSSGYASDLYLNRDDMVSAKGMEREIIMNSCIDDLSREQLSHMVRNDLKGGRFEGFMKALAVAKNSTTRYIRFPQSLHTDIELDEIWLHCGTGLGDMLMAGSAIESMKRARPGIRIGMTVKSNDEGGNKRGNKVFSQIFGNNPYIDKVEFFDMEKRGTGYVITLDEIRSRGIDPDLMFSVDLVPSHLMKHGTRTSVLTELWRCLNVAPNWNQTIFTDVESDEFGVNNADNKTVLFCLEGSAVHNGKTTLTQKQCTELVDTLRGRLDGWKFVGMGFGSDEREKWYSELFDECFYNKTTIREDIELIRNAGLLVGVDTGMSHVAMHLDVPLLGIYHAANLRYWVDEYYLRDPHNGFVVCPGDNLSTFNALYAKTAVDRILSKAKKPDKVVVVLPGGRGDNILAEPAIRKLSESVDIAISTQWPQLWNGHESISFVHSMLEPKSPFASKKLLGRRTIMMSGVHGLIENDNEMHVCDAYAKLAGVKIESHQSRFYLEKWEQKRAHMIASSLRTKLVAIAPEAMHPNKMWFGAKPDDFWRQLIVSIRKMHMDVVVIGASDVFDVPCANFLASEHSERESVAFLTECDYFIGIDSFMAHAAASVGTRGLVIWGSTSPANWGYDTLTNITGYSGFQCAPCNRPRPYVPDVLIGQDGTVDTFVCGHKSCMRRCTPDVVLNCFRFMVEGQNGKCFE